MVKMDKELVKKNMIIIQLMKIVERACARQGGYYKISLIFKW